MNVRACAIALLGLLAASPLAAQTVDVTKSLADPKAYIFDDQKTTVKAYVVAELEAKTTCCGQDAIYLEVEVDTSGYVNTVKVLTGKNECYKQAVIDVVKNIRWMAKDFKAPRPVYFQVKPDIQCAGRNNQYAPIPVFNNPLAIKGSAAAQPAAAQPVATPPAAAVAAQQPPAQPQPVAQTTAPPVAVVPTLEPAAIPQAPQNAPAMMMMAGGTRGGESLPTATQLPTQQPSAPVNTEAVNAEIQRLRAELSRLKAEESAKQRELAQASQDDRAKVDAFNKLKTPPTPAPASGKKPAAPTPNSDDETADLLPGEETEAGIYSDEQASNPRDVRGKRPAAAKPGNTPAAKPGDKVAGPAKPGDKADPRTLKPGEKPDPKTTAAKPGPIDSPAKVLDPVMQLEKQIKDMELKIAQQQREEEKKQAELAKYYAEMDKLRAQQAKMQEETLQKEEQARLNAIAKQKAQADSLAREQERKAQLAQDEMKDLQQKIATAMADIEKYRELAAAKELERQEAEQKIMMERKARQMNLSVPALPTALQPASGTGARGMAAAPTDTTFEGIMKWYIQRLTEQIDVLNKEMMRMRIQIASGSSTANAGILPVNTAGSTNGQPQTPRTIAGTGSKGQGSTNAPVAKLASSDASWQKTNYAGARSTEDGKANATAIQTSVADNRRYAQQATAQPNTPAPPAEQQQIAAHADTHKNVPGPVFSMPEYEEGETGMRNFIKSQLRQGGVCGLAQAIAEVSVSPQGDVVAFRVLRANSPQVETLMPGILTNLKFRPSASKAVYTSYIQFKAEVNCDDKATQPSGAATTAPSFINLK